MTSDAATTRTARVDWGTAAVLLAALAGAAALLWATSPWGSGIDNDVVDFFSAAESLLDGRGWVQSNGEPFALWPPLMPTLLAAAHALGIPLEVTPWVLHPLALIALVWLAADIVRRVSGSTAAAVACAWSLAVAPVLFESLVMGLSETLFVTFALASVAALERHLSSGSRASFAACALFASLTFLQRYLGVTLVMALCLVLALAPGKSWGARLRTTLTFGALALAPMVAWCLRTRAATGHLTGNRGTLPGPSLSVIAEWTWQTFSGWLWPGAGERPVAQVLAGLALVLVAGALLWPARPASAPAPRRWAALAAFPFVYFALSTYLNHRWAIDGVGDRQLVPLAPFAAIFGALGFAAARARVTRASTRRVFDVLCALALLVHLGAALSHLQTRIAQWRAEGPGVYATRSFRACEFHALLRTFALDGKVESNDPHAVYYLTRHYARMAPRRPGGYLKLGAGTTARGLAPTLVWFEQNARAIAPLAELSPAFEITELARAPGGAIYSVRAR